MCQTRMVSSLVSDEMREFLALAVESMIQQTAHEVVGGNLNVVHGLIPTLGVLQLLDHDRAAYVADRLDDMGIFILMGEDD